MAASARRSVLSSMGNHAPVVRASTAVMLSEENVRSEQPIAKMRACHVAPREEGEEGTLLPWLRVRCARTHGGPCDVEHAGVVVAEEAHPVRISSPADGHHPLQCTHRPVV